MNLRVSILLLTTVLPGLGAMALSTFYLFPEWAALDKSYRNYEKLAAAGANVRELSIAQSAEMRHRLNCFAEGVGVLLGGVIVAIGVHGCTLPKQQ
ncbi:hypothetical protein [Phormidesmis priestleyi]